MPLDAPGCLGATDWVLPVLANIRFGMDWPVHIMTDVRYRIRWANLKKKKGLFMTMFSCFVL